MFELEGDKHVVLSDNPSIEEIAGHSAKFFKDDWKISRDYIYDDLIKYNSKSLNINKVTNNSFMYICLYMASISHDFININYDGIPKLALNELIRWDLKGGLCIYNSILNYCLLYESGLYGTDELRLVQGFYKHPLQSPFNMFLESPSLQVGIHSFIVANGSVIDFAIIQERCVFESMEDDWIIGEIPEGMELYGWEEKLTIVKSYAREIAKESGMTYHEWITTHKRDALIVVKEVLKKMK